MVAPGISPYWSFYNAFSSNTMAFGFSTGALTDCYLIFAPAVENLPQLREKMGAGFKDILLDETV